MILNRMWLRRLLHIGVILALAMWIAGAFPSTALAANSPPDQGLLPSSPLPISPLHQEVSVFNYMFDGQYGTFNVLAWAFNALANLVWLLYLLIMKLVMWVLEQAFTLQLHESVLNVMSEYLLALEPAFWSQGMQMALWFVGSLWFGWTMVVRRNLARAIGGLAIMATVSVLALTGNGGGIAWFGSTANWMSRDIAANILIAGAYDMPAPAPDDDALAVAGSYYSDKVWRQMVAEPWCILEFGSKKTCEQYTSKSGTAKFSGDMVLYQTEDGRNSWYKGLGDDAKKELTWMNTLRGAIIRAAFALLLLVAAGLFAGWIGYAAANILANAFKALWWGIMTPFFFMVAFFPNWTVPVLRFWFKRMVEPYVSLIAYAVVLTVALTGASVSWAVFATAGWLAQLVGLFIWTLMVISYAGGIVAFVTNLPSGIGAAVGAVESHKSGLAETRARGLLAAVGVARAGRAIGGLGTAVRNVSDRRTAARTLTRRLANDQIQYARTGQKSDLMVKHEQRRDLGARHLWDDQDLAEEVARNQRLRQLGVHPDALPVSGQSTREARDHIANLRERMAQDMRRLQAEQQLARQRGLWTQNSRLGRLVQQGYSLMTQPRRAVGVMQAHAETSVQTATTVVRLRQAANRRLQQERRQAWAHQVPQTGQPVLVAVGTPASPAAQPPISTAAIGPVATAGPVLGYPQTQPTVQQVSQPHQTASRVTTVRGGAPSRRSLPVLGSPTPVVLYGPTGQPLTIVRAPARATPVAGPVIGPNRAVMPRQRVRVPHRRMVAWQRRRSG